LRGSSIAAVVLAGAEVDQTAGLLTLTSAGRSGFTACRQEAPGIVMPGIMMP
jgi:hypothetical protein